MKTRMLALSLLSLAIFGASYASAMPKGLICVKSDGTLVSRTRCRTGETQLNVADLIGPQGPKGDKGDTGPGFSLSQCRRATAEESCAISGSQRCYKEIIVRCGDNEFAFSAKKQEWWSYSSDFSQMVNGQRDSSQAGKTIVNNPPEGNQLPLTFDATRMVNIGSSYVVYADPMDIAEGTYTITEKVTVLCCPAGDPNP
jgi:hypothetical protein